MTCCFCRELIGRHESYRRFIDELVEFEFDHRGDAQKRTEKDIKYAHVECARRNDVGEKLVKALQEGATQ